MGSQVRGAFSLSQSFGAFIRVHSCLSLRARCSNPTHKGGLQSGHMSRWRGVRTHRMHTYTQEITGADVLEILLCLSFEEEGGGGGGG